MTPMNDKIKKAIELLRYARSLPPNDAGGYEDNLQWGKDVDALLNSLAIQPQEPTPSPEDVCETCGGAKEIACDVQNAPISCPSCQPVEPKHITPKPETSLTPAKGKCIECFGHSVMMGSCKHCGGSGKEPKAEAQQPWTIHHVKNYPDMALARIHDLEAENGKGKEGIISLATEVNRLEAELDEANTQADDCKNGACNQLTEAKRDAEAFESTLQQKKAALSGCMRENRELKAKLVEAMKGI